MKNHLSVLALCCVIVFSCKKNLTPGIPNDPELTAIDTTITKIAFSGNFIKGPWGTTSGIAKVIITKGKLQLRLDSFMVSSGPDLKVYISKEVQPLNFIRLGDLKGLSGDQLYDIPGNPDFKEYPYALIYCEKFNHLFGSALLMKL